MKKAPVGSSRAREADELAVRFERMLSSVLTPDRTKAGSVATQAGVPRYGELEWIVFCGAFLGESIPPDVLLELRKGANGKTVPARVRQIVETAVDRFERGDNVPRLVQKQHARDYAWSSIQFWEAHGVTRCGRTSIVEAVEFWFSEKLVFDVELFEYAVNLELERGLREPLQATETRPSAPEPLPGGEDEDEELRRRISALEPIPDSVRQYLGPNGFIWNGPAGEELPVAIVGREALRTKLERAERCEQN